MDYYKNFLKELQQRFNLNESQCISCGLTPTGIPHLGSFREPIIGYIFSLFINKKTNIRLNLIYDIDDIDPYTKPSVYYSSLGVSFEENRGRPISMIEANKMRPGQRITDQFFIFLSKLNIFYSHIKTSEVYHIPEFVEYVREALRAYSLSGGNPIEVIRVYCPQTLVQENTKVLSYNLETNICVFRQLSTGQIFSFTLGDPDIYYKLKYHIEWLCKQSYKNTVCEPTGGDHALGTGVSNRSKNLELCKYSRKLVSALVMPYQFVISQHGKISKSRSVIGGFEYYERRFTPLSLIYYLGNNPAVELKLPDNEVFRSFYVHFFQLIKIYVLRNRKNLSQELENLLQDELRRDNLVDKYEVLSLIIDNNLNIRDSLNFFNISFDTYIEWIYLTSNFYEFSEMFRTSIFFKSSFTLPNWKQHLEEYYLIFKYWIEDTPTALNKYQLAPSTIRTISVNFSDLLALRYIQHHLPFVNWTFRALEDFFSLTFDSFFTCSRINVYKIFYRILLGVPQGPNLLKFLIRLEKREVLERLSRIFFEQV